MGLIDNTMRFFGIRELSERLAHDYFNDPSSTDSGTTSENIHILDVLNDKTPTDNHRSIDFYNSISHPTQVSTISDLATPSVFHQPLICPPPIFIHSILFQK